MRSAAGFAYVEPERRENPDDLKTKKRTKLITHSDLRGTFHVHTTYSDGRNTMEEMLTLPGAARKTANVVLGTAYGVASGVVVDTHVTRLSHRLDLTQQKTAEKIEQDLIPIVPKKDWVIFPHLLISHGRKICKARNPLCAECPVEKLCPSSWLKTGVHPAS